jgi:glutamate--cysteine ligase catalytic subunit
LIAASVDDRTKEETGVLPLDKDRFRINKSRYDSINKYLSPGPSYSGGCGKTPIKLNGKVHGDFFKPEYDDLNPAYDEVRREN